jgi:hypothetical protein
MQLLSVAAARSTWLFDANDLNPQGKNFLPGLIGFLKTKYEFNQCPKSPTDLGENKGLNFKQGSFRVNDENLISVGELSIFSDGFAANTFSTTIDTDKFLEDAISSANLEFRLAYSPAMIRSKIPLSELVVRLDGTLAQIDPKLNDFATKISKCFEQSTIPPFEVGGISFWTDSTKCAVPVTPAPFTIERKVGAPFKENRFYSKASLHTDKHLELLSDFESLMTNRL